MKKIKMNVLLVLMYLLVFICEKEEDHLDDYLPLEIGNYWKLDISEKKPVTGIINYSLPELSRY